MSAVENGSPLSPGDDVGPPDAAVVRRVLHGHPDEYEVLVRRYQARFFRFAFGMVDDSDAAMDLAQDSFVGAYANLARCRDPSQFGAWAYQILRNRCRDFLKDVRRAHEPLEEHPELISATGSPVRDFERSELRRMLRDALASLPAAHREAFLLKHLEGYGYEEISRALGASTSAVKMRVHRSREMLRSYLEGEGRAMEEVTFAATRSSSQVEGRSDARQTRRNRT